MRFLLSLFALASLFISSAYANGCSLSTLEVGVCSTTGCVLATLNPAFFSGREQYLWKDGSMAGYDSYLVSNLDTTAFNVWVHASPVDTTATCTWQMNGHDRNFLPGGWEAIDTSGYAYTILLDVQGTNYLSIRVTTAQCSATYDLQIPNVGILTTPNVPAESEALPIVIPIPVANPPQEQQQQPQPNPFPEQPQQGGFVIGDPQFTGLKGQSYQVHGVAGEIYNIISSPQLQLNARFVFLTQGKCPVFNGQRAQGCWSHPGTYLGELGAKTAGGDRIHLVAGSADNGYATVTVNGKSLKVGDVAVLKNEARNNEFFLARNSSHVVTLQADHFYIELENSDMYVNQKLRVTNWNDFSAHGLLGQTHRVLPKNKVTGLPIEGTVDDYVIAEKDVFGDSFVYNQFQPATQ